VSRYTGRDVRYEVIQNNTISEKANWEPEVDGGARSGAGEPEVERGSQKWSGGARSGAGVPGVEWGIFIFGKSLSNLEILVNYY